MIMKKKKVKNDFDTHREGVLLEDMNEKITIMAEMLIGVKNTQDENTEILIHHSDVLAQHSGVLKVIDSKLDNKVDRKEFEKRIKPLEHRMI